MSEEKAVKQPIKEQQKLSVLTREQQLRLECLNLVMINGTSSDRSNPLQKADILFKYVVSGL